MASDENRVIDGSAIVEMEIVGDDESDYSVDLSGGTKSSPRQRSPEGGSEQMNFNETTKSQIATGVASYFLEEGRQRAKKAFSLYANIDILRPYFDVEPNIVKNRLIHSLIPKIPKSGSHQEKVPRELYGPTMLVFTMIALLLFQMKLSDHSVQEGTLMGTAFGVCFTYWIGVSSLLWSMSYIFNTHLGLLQILSLLGYALFGHCIALFLSTVIHTNHSHFLFYVFWLSFGGLATLRMVSVLYSRTSGQTQRMIVCGVVAAVHMIFLLYLHFAYHQIVSDISLAMGGKPVVPKMATQNIDAGGEIDNNNQIVLANRDLQESVGKEVVQSITESVKRIVREVNIPNELPANLNQTLPKANGPNLIEAIIPKKLEFPLNKTGHVILQALNGTKH